MLHKINIFQALYEREGLPNGLPEPMVNGRHLDTGQNPSVPQGNMDSYSLRLMPYYVQFANIPKQYCLKKVPQFNWGHSIDLKGFPSVDDYMESQFKSKTRSIIKRYIKRLEICFPISYRYYYGEMEHGEYTRIFESLEQMILNRFEQREETHKEMWRWKALKDSTYDLILSKKASFFVIFDGNTPIEISLNYHLEGILFSSISSFDTDYTKFGLGHVEIYKQLEWCLQNGCSIFEMGVGGMDYKRRWSNRIYQFDHCILFPKKTSFSKFVGTMEYWRIQVKEYLKSKKINELKDTLLRKLDLKRKHNEAGEMPFSHSLLGHPPKNMELYPLSFSEPSPNGLKKALYDLLYLQEVSREKIELFKGGGHYYAKLESKWFLLQRENVGASAHSIPFEP